MAKHRGIWPLGWLCEALLGAIHRSFTDSDRTHGARRIRRHLSGWGQPCSIHRAQRLMVSAGLKARRKPRRVPHDLGQRQQDAMAGNVLDRNFVATRPNQRWVADFTYLWTEQGWLYVAVVLDLYSRMVVGGSMQSSMAAQRVSDAMLMAIWRRRPNAQLLHHSDRGSQYTSDQFQQLLTEHGVICSRAGQATVGTTRPWKASSRRSRPNGQAARSTGQETRPERICSITSNGSTIKRRRHSTLDYLTPLEFENQRKSG
jgi:putative transposase